jgi:CheY-like chemotaxis protein
MAFTLHPIVIGMRPSSAHTEPILVVEDNADVRDMMAVTLELEGHRVVTASNGREALYLLHHGVEPCMILLDLMMPVMNGWEFQEAVEREPELRDIPIVVVSATGPEMNPTHAAAVLPKPIDVDRLLDVVEDLCDGVRRSH